MFGELYDIEDRAKLMSPGERRTLRRAEAKPVWERMTAYLASDAVAGVMPKESFGKPITYIRSQFEHLLVYLDVFAYLKDVLDRLWAGDADYAAMRPDLWKQSHPDAIRQYRVKERMARADAKMTKRAK